MKKCYCIKFMNKNKKLLDEFVEYCNEHPKQRFWQALRNWSKEDFIVAKDISGNEEDTFYWVGKNRMYEN